MVGAILFLFISTMDLDQNKFSELRFFNVVTDELTIF